MKENTVKSINVHLDAYIFDVLIYVYNASDFLTCCSHSTKLLILLCFPICTVLQFYASNFNRFFGRVDTYVSTYIIRRISGLQYWLKYSMGLRYSRSRIKRAANSAHVFPVSRVQSELQNKHCHRHFFKEAPDRPAHNTYDSRNKLLPHDF